MNRLSIKMTTAQHKSARVKVVTCAEDIPSRIGNRTEILKAIKRYEEENAQVKADLGIEFTTRYCGLNASKLDPTWIADAWEITGKGDFKLEYRTGVGHRLCYTRTTWGGQDEYHACIVPPSALAILYAIRSDDPQDEAFESWAVNFGYDSDSRKALKIYRACVEQTMMFRRNYPGVNLYTYQPLENY